MDEEMRCLRDRVDVLENVVREMNQMMNLKFELVLNYFNNKMDVSSKSNDEESRIYRNFRDEFLSLSSTSSRIGCPAIFPSSSSSSVRSQSRGSNSSQMHNHAIFSLSNENLESDKSINKMSKLDSPRVPLSPIIHRSTSGNSFSLYKSSPSATTTSANTNNTNQELKVKMIDSDENGSPSLLSSYRPRRKLFQPSVSSSSRSKSKVQKPEPVKSKVQVKKDKDRISDSKLQVAIIDKRNKIAKDFDEPKSKISNSPKYAYVPKKAIRGKKERANLEGWDCDVCVEYYKALGSQLDDDKIKELQNKCSRHRSKYQYRNPNTPPGYWRTDFPSTESCRELGIGYYGQNEDEDV